MTEICRMFVGLALTCVPDTTIILVFGGCLAGQILWVMRYGSDQTVPLAQAGLRIRRDPPY